MPSISILTIKGNQLIITTKQSLFTDKNKIALVAKSKYLNRIILINKKYYIQRFV